MRALAGAAPRPRQLREEGRLHRARADVRLSRGPGAGAGARAPGARGAAALRAGRARHERPAACRSRASAPAVTPTQLRGALRTARAGPQARSAADGRADRGALRRALRAAGTASAGRRSRGCTGVSAGSEARHFELYVGFAHGRRPQEWRRAAAAARARARRSWRPPRSALLRFHSGPLATAGVNCNSCLQMAAPAAVIVSQPRHQMRCQLVSCPGILTLERREAR